VRLFIIYILVLYYIYIGVAIFVKNSGSRYLMVVDMAAYLTYMLFRQDSIDRSCDVQCENL
jgi:hypothetical protein